MRYLPIVIVVLLLVAFIALGMLTHWAWHLPATLCAFALAIGVYDFFQPHHSVLRNYPILGHFRWFAEDIRPEIQQYFIERDTDGKPFSRDARSLVYERAKDAHGEKAFGTELNVYASGYEWFTHSIAPKHARGTSESGQSDARQGRPTSATSGKPPSTNGGLPDYQERVKIGGPQCQKPYEMSLFNVSAMSFGSLSSNAIRALNTGAKMGGFAHDTGEGGLTKYHLEPGGDLVWEIGSGYFGCRTRDGQFDLDTFTQKAQHDHVKCVSVKLSQGAKPGLGGVMPAEKVTPEIAEIRGVPVGEKCISPPYHTAFQTPRELLTFVQTLREATGGKPTGFKLCIGRPSEFFGICKAMLETGIQPDFIIVDGSEGGTGAAPLEFEDHVGTPLTEGLIFVHNALIGCGLRGQIKIGCSGKVTSSFEMARRIAIGADYCNAARGMMFALGCIQAMRCQTNRCPVGVATQDPQRVRALVVPLKAERVFNYHRNTVLSFNQLIASLGLDSPSQLNQRLLMRRVNPTLVQSYEQLYPTLEAGILLGDQVPEHLRDDWNTANADRFS
ncbi:MAG: FMN-binding glutamate synthase family protein [Planctomycetaceae bacterium]|nr:FMN-binding glutamate synthase family protein [Planctomycetaceae bacterium]